MVYILGDGFLRKLVIYLVAFVLLCFAIPIMGTNRFEEKKEEQNQKQEEVKNEIIPSTYDYKNYATISLLHKKENQVEQIKLDDYLYGVVSAEMPADFEIEALKAQAVVARTYTVYKIINSSNKHEGADICDDSTCCQAWINKENRFARWDEEKRQANWDKIVEAVNSTQGKIITYQGEPINAFFHSNSGGETEAPVNVWGGTGYPYLQTVQTAGEDAYSQYYSEVILTKEQVVEKIRQKYPEVEVDWNAQDSIQILEYTEGNRVKTLKVGNVNLSGVEARSIFELKSANFSFELQEDQIKFFVKGYGHGVGMSQTGADSMAKSGSNYEEIIKHFYVETEIVNM